MPVLIYYSEPNEQHDENNQIQYSPPTLEVSLDPEEVIIVRHKRLDEMTREDVDAEIHWAGSVFEPDLVNRRFAEPLIDILCKLLKMELFLSRTVSALLLSHRPTHHGTKWIGQSGLVEYSRRLNR